jgi:hypothetical protein
MSKDNKERKAELSDRMKDTSFAARCEVLRDLAALGWDKPLNESIGALMRSVRQVLGTEWAAAEGASLDDALVEVDGLLATGKRTYKL